jgi:hypothetical protein
MTISFKKILKDISIVCTVIANHHNYNQSPLFFFDVFLNKVGKKTFLLNREHSRKTHCNTQHNNGNTITHTTDVNKCMALQQSYA